MGLITLVEYKNIIGSTRTEDDTRLQSFIDYSSGVFENMTARKFIEATFDEKFDGNGKRRLHLPNFPITVVNTASITENKVVKALTIADDLVIYKEDGYIEINVDSTLFSIFTKGQQNVAINYDAGFTNIPDDIKAVVAELTATLFRRVDRQQGPFSTKAFQGGSVVFKPNDINDLFREIVKQYKRRGSQHM